jgi:LPS export ABC transporter permease LptF/LPS export ABC transporter permease LptG
MFHLPFFLHLRFFRLFRYLLAETIPYILLVLLTLSVLILVQQVARQSDLLFGSAASLAFSLRLIFSLLPGVLVITLPFSLLIGSLMALNRLSSDSEITAAKAAGIPSIWLASPFLFCGILGLWLSAFLTIQVIPNMYSEARMLRTQLLLRALTAPLRPQTFETHFPNHLIYIRDIDKSSGDWLGVFIVRKDHHKESLVLTARRGRLRLTQTTPITLEVDLFDGLLLTISDPTPEKQTIASFQQQDIKLSSADPTLTQAIEKERATQELSLLQLAQRSQRAGTPQEQRQAKVEWHKRLALPTACLLLVLLALPLGVSLSRQTGRAVAFSVGFGLAILYYLTLLAGQNLALSGAVPAWLGTWLPNLLGGLAILGQGQTSGRFFQPGRLRSTAKPRRLIKSTLNIYLSTRLFKSRPSLILSLINYLLLSEMIKYFLLSLATLVLTSLIFTLFDLLPSHTRSGLGWKYTGGYLLYLAPQIIYYISPFAVLLALLTSYSVLARSQQITALLTSGQSTWRLAAPFLFGAFLVIISLFWLSEAILPTANREQDARYHRIKGRKTEQAVLALGQHWVQGVDGTIYGYQYDNQANILLNTTAYYLDDQQGRLREVLYAAQTTPANESHWRVLQGWRTRISASALQFIPMTTNDQLHVPESNTLFLRIVNEATKMGFYELRQYIGYLSDIKAPTTALRVELEKKLSFPFSCLPLLAIALPLALKNKQRGTLAGVGLSIVIGFTFWITASLFESLGRQAYLPPGLSVWGPQALFFALGIFLVFRQRQ